MNVRDAEIAAEAVEEWDVPATIDQDYESEKEEQTDISVSFNESEVKKVESTRSLAIPRKAASGDLLGTMPASRLVTLLEAKEISVSSVQRALMMWKPKGNDVVLVGPGMAGESIVARMIRLLTARFEGLASEAAPEELEAGILSEAPIIESTIYDGQGFKVLNGSQAPFKRRLFRTSLTYRALHDKLTTPGAVKYVVLGRNPVDARAAWFSKVRRLYAQSLDAQADIEDALYQFDLKYCADDFMHAPGMHLHGRESGRADVEGGDVYESNLADWALEAEHQRERENPTVLVLLLEEVLSQPEIVMEKLAVHLGYDPALVTPSLLDHVAGAALLRSKGATQDLTRDQRRFLKLRFAPGEGGIEKAPSGHDDRVAWGIKAKMMGAVNVSSRGVFVAERPPHATFPGKSPRPVAKSLAQTRDAVLSSLAVGELSLTWKNLSRLRSEHLGSSYEEFYTKQTGDAYPYAMDEPAPLAVDANASETGSPRRKRTNSFMSPLASMRKIFSARSDSTRSSHASSFFASRASSESFDTR